MANTIEVITQSETPIPNSDVSTPCTDQAHVKVELAYKVLRAYIGLKDYSVAKASETEVQITHTHPDTQVTRSVTFRGSDTNMDTLYMFAGDHVFTHITDL